MQPVNVTPRVWDRLLRVRDGYGCLCGRDWSQGEKQALSVYGALAQPVSNSWVLAQIGQSLDGRIATESGDSKDISGKDGLTHLHRLRALADAVVIGVQTALHDNPRLTVRLARGNNPVRVVIDPNGRLPNDVGLLQDRTTRPIIIQCTDTPRSRDIDAIKLPRTKWIKPQQILSALSQRGLHRVLIEGGGITIAQFLEAGLLTRLHVAVAPLLIGAGPQGLTTSPVATLAHALRPKMDVYNLGSDVLFDCTLNNQHRMTQTFPFPCRTSDHTSPRVHLAPSIR